jgi:thiol-disulfide isomerase/thioredoxin
MTKVLALALVVVSLPAFAQDRIQIWNAVEDYNYSNRVVQDGHSRWVREAGNQNKSQAEAEAEAEAELGLKRPDPAPALKAALQVAQANPTDDLGFMAISFCLYGSRAAEEKEKDFYRTSAIDLLERHYLNDARLSKIVLGLARFGGKPGIALLDEVVRKSTRRTLRAEAAFWSASERMMAVDDLTIPETERSAIRADVTRLAKLVSTELSDVRMRGGTAGEAIEPVLYALEHLSIGSVLPDATATRIGGGQEKLSDYCGKVVLLDFWATWCVPCVKSLPKVVKLKEELKDRPFEVITLSIDEVVSVPEKFMKEQMEMPFVNWHIGKGSELYRRWNIQGVPTYILVDQKGIVRGRTNNVETLHDIARKLAGG